MEKVNIDSQILDQMNRQIDLAYWLSSIIITIAIFVVGYQVYINSRAINNLKKENAKNIKKSSTKLFKLTLQSAIKFGYYTYIDLNDYFEMYFNIIGDDEEILSLLQIIKYKSIEQIFTNFLKFDFSGPSKVPEKIVQKLLSIENNEDDILKVIDEIELEEDTDKTEIVNQIILLKKLFNKYGI